MSKDNIAQQYNNMVASIEDAKIYDGGACFEDFVCIISPPHLHLMMKGVTPLSLYRVTL